MVVQCQGSAEEVLARLDALSREWRDSQFPVEFNHALGRVPIRITRESAHRFRIVVGLASRTLHDIATDIEVIEDQFGTTMRFDPQLTPGFLGAWWRYAALLAVPMLLFGWREGWSLSRFYFIPFAALVLTTIGYVYATTVDDQIEVGVHKLLKRIAKPNDAPTTA